ncbi:MAG: hypothetical protein IPG12_11395 [Saprospiraceae bacterium]|nr:hypothetical protein [Saprospiraceae bacterium]
MKAHIRRLADVGSLPARQSQAGSPASATNSKAGCKTGFCDLKEICSSVGEAWLVSMVPIPEEGVKVDIRFDPGFISNLLSPQINADLNNWFSLKINL